MFSTGNIQTKDYCLEAYRQHNSDEAFSPFLWNTWEIESTLSLTQPEFLKSQRTLSNFLDTLKN